MDLIFRNDRLRIMDTSDARMVYAMAVHAATILAFWPGVHIRHSSVQACHWAVLHRTTVFHALVRLQKGKNPAAPRTCPQWYDGLVIEEEPTDVA